MTPTPVCVICRGRRTVTVCDFDGATVEPCPACTAKDPHERARAALAREFGSDRQRRERRLPMRAPRSEVRG